MTDTFNSGYLRVDQHGPQRARHGLPWSDLELKTLKMLFNNGYSLSYMCSKLERPAAGVLAKLDYFRLISYVHGDDQHTVLVTRTGTPGDDLTVTPPQEEPTMAQDTPNIETKTFIQGEDATGMTDAAIFHKIAKLEKQIEDLNKIITKPQKLINLIHNIQLDIDKLVSFVDGRA